MVGAFEKYGAMEYTIVVTASASEPAPLQFLAPYSGAMAKSSPTTAATCCASTMTFPSTHPPTASCRCCCAARRSAGRTRETVFYLHSRLLERACKLSKEKGAGSLTALPFIEPGGDVSAYIPTT